MKSSVCSLIVALFVAALCACNGAQENDRAPQSLQFDVVEEYLAEEQTFQEAGVAFRPPREWGPVNSEALRNARESTRRSDPNTETGLAVVPVGAFVHPRNGKVLVVSDLRYLSSSGLASNAGADAAAHRNRVVADYLSALTRNLQPEERSDDSSTDPQNAVTTATFRLDAFTAHQVRAINAQTLSFVLILIDEAGNACQLDYILPRPVDQEAIKRIESSIGSVRLLPQAY